MNSIYQDVDGRFFVSNGVHRTLNTSLELATAYLQLINEWGWSSYNDGKDTYKLYLA